MSNDKLSAERLAENAPCPYCDQPKGKPCIRRVTQSQKNMGMLIPAVKPHGDRIIAALTRENAELEAKVEEAEVAALSWDKCKLKARIAELETMIKHCDNCGGSWVDDGINSQCGCYRRLELEAALAKEQGKSRENCD